MSRWITAALVSQPTAHPVAPMLALHRGVAVTGRVSRHRLALACVMMLASRDRARIGRGLEAVFVRAARTLPPLTQAARDEGQRRAEAVHEGIAAVAQERRVGVILACAATLLEDAPSDDVWDDVVSAIVSAARYARVRIGDHEEEAARVLRAAGVIEEE